MITRIIPHRKISLCSLLLALLAPVLLTAGCNDTQENEGARDPTTPLPEPKPKPKTYPLVITDIRNLPPKTTFDRIAVQITGVDWSIIATVEAPYMERAKYQTVKNKQIHHNTNNYEIQQQNTHVLHGGVPKSARLCRFQ